MISVLLVERFWRSQKANFVISESRVKLASVMSSVSNILMKIVYRMFAFELAVDSLFEGRSGEMVTIYNATPQTVSLEKVLGSGATGETSKGGSHNVDPNGFVVKTARNTGISFGD